MPNKNDNNNRVFINKSKDSVFTYFIYSFVGFRILSIV